MTTRTPPRSRRSLVVLSLAATLALGLAACGDDEDDGDVSAGAEAGDTGSTTGSTGTEAAVGDGYGGVGGAADPDGEAPTSAKVVAEDFSFTTATVPAGSEVTFVNEDSAPHTMTADDGSFDSGTVEGGESATVTAPAVAGDYAFTCQIHPDMQATLTVD